ncbi:unnamed protein product [Gadus morhua 'NCC']
MGFRVLHKLHDLISPTQSQSACLGSSDTLPPTDNHLLWLCMYVFMNVPPRQPPSLSAPRRLTESSELTGVALHYGPKKLGNVGLYFGNTGITKRIGMPLGAPRPISYSSAVALRHCSRGGPSTAVGRRPRYTVNPRCTFNFTTPQRRYTVNPGDTVHPLTPQHRHNSTLLHLNPVTTQPCYTSTPLQLSPATPQPRYTSTLLHCTLNTATTQPRCAPQPRHISTPLPNSPLQILTLCPKHTQKHPLPPARSV